MAPDGFTIASTADLTGSFSLCLWNQTSILHSDHSYDRQRERERETAEWKQGIKRWWGKKKLDGEGRKKEAEKDRTITVEGDHHHIRVFHEKATSGA